MRLVLTEIRYVFLAISMEVLRRF